MDFIITLAHFCETHGPTTILCTQLNPISCQSCFPGPPTPATSDTLTKNNSFSSEIWENSSPVVTPSTGPLFSPFTSPPTSPRLSHANHNPYFAHVAGDTKSRRFSVNSESDGDGCDSCILLVPEKRVKGYSDDEQGSPLLGAKSRNKSHVLRSTYPVQAYGAGSDSDTDDDEVAIARQRTPNHASPPAPMHMQASLGSTRSRTTPLTHTHKLTYVTRRSPESQSLYSRLRHSCIRTLSSESLPRGSSSGAFSFGDPIAGYTIAYIFRLPDARARGRRRTYALTALTRDNHRAMSAFVPVTKAFEAIANYIIALTDRAIERENGSLQKSPSTSAEHLRSSPLSASVPLKERNTLTTSPPPDRSRSTTSSPTSASTAIYKSSHYHNISDISSFLVAKKIDPDGYSRSSNSHNARELTKARGLPEIAGHEGLYPDLHLKNAAILTNLLTKLPR